MGIFGNMAAAAAAAAAWAAVVALIGLVFAVGEPKLFFLFKGILSLSKESIRNERDILSFLDVFLFFRLQYVGQRDVRLITFKSELMLSATQILIYILKHPYLRHTTTLNRTILTVIANKFWVKVVVVVEVIVV